MTDKHAHLMSEGHTVKRFDGEMNKLRLRVLEMGGLALAQLKDALRALTHRDVVLAQNIGVREAQIDQMEVETDADIVGLIARRCPLGGDLRMVMAISKTVTDLERIGDEAVRIANIVQQVFGTDGGAPSEHLLRDVNIMGQLAVEALEKSLHAFDNLDEDAAQALLETQDKLEDEFEAGLRRLITYVMEDSRTIGFAVSLVLAIKSLERIGAHAHNVAEYVIYQVRGQDIRHQHP